MADDMGPQRAQPSTVARISAQMRAFGRAMLPDSPKEENAFVTNAAPLAALGRRMKAAQEQVEKEGMRRMQSLQSSNTFKKTVRVAVLVSLDGQVIEVYGSSAETDEEMKDAVAEQGEYRVRPHWCEPVIMEVAVAVVVPSQE